MSNEGAPPLAAAPADAALVERYLEHVRVERRLAARTVTLYSLDLEKLSDFAAAAGIGLRAVQPAHVRRWVAQMHAGGRSGRGIALVLSGWRGFYAWLGREGRVAANPVQDVRAPRQPRPLPKALGVDDAVRLADFHADGDATDPWLEARDAALVELLLAKRLLTDSGGPGRWRGGLGQEVILRNDTGNTLTMLGMGNRMEFPSQGMFGGGAGSLRVHAVDGKPVHAMGRIEVAPGQRITVIEAGGGGFGNPRQRNRDAVQADILDGLVSAEAARTVYGA